MPSSYEGAGPVQKGPPQLQSGSVLFTRREVSGNAVAELHWAGSYGHAGKVESTCRAEGCAPHRPLEARKLSETTSFSDTKVRKRRAAHAQSDKLNANHGRRKRAAQLVII